jgi:hypothetical protein
MEIIWRASAGDISLPALLHVDSCHAEEALTLGEAK